MTRSDVEALANLHSMLTGNEQPDYGNRKERRAVAAKKRRSTKKKTKKRKPRSLAILHHFVYGQGL